LQLPCPATARQRFFNSGRIITGDRQFILGRFIFWIKPKLSAFLLLLLVIGLTIYIHSQYLSYIEYTQRISVKDFGIGVSFIIKNTIIILAIIIYLIFTFMLNKAKPNQTKTTEIINKDNDNERVDSLDFLLEKDKLENKFDKKDN
jgi:predicted membrane protein